MKIKSLKVRGVGVFRDECVVPIADLGDAELVAVVGENGAGKSTMVECLPAALYRTMPSRGSLAALANSKTSEVEAVIETDREYTLRVMVDGLAKPPKTSAYITADGKPLNDGKAMTFDAQVAKLFPSSEVYLSSAFAAQSGEGRFLSLPATERKKLFAEMLGLGRLQELSEMAADKQAHATRALDALKVKAATLATTADRVDGLTTAHDAAAGAATLATAYRADLEGKEADQRKSLESWSAELVRLEREVASAENAVAAEKRKADSHAEEVTRTKARLATIAGQQLALKAKASKRGELQGIVNDAIGAPAELEAAEKANADDLAKSRESAEKLHAWERARADASHAAEKATADHRRTSAEAQALAESLKTQLDTLGRAAAGVDRVPCKGEGDFAGCVLISAAIKARGELDALAAKVLEAGAKAKAIADDKSAVDAAKRQLDAVGERPAVETALHQIDTQRLRMRIANATDARARLEAIAETEAQAAVLEAEAVELQAHADAATDMHAEASKTLEVATVALAHARVDVEEHRALKPVAITADVLDRARRDEREAAAKVASLAEALRQATDAAAQLAGLATEQSTAAADVDDWSSLATALGRNGVQALEIDAAGPEVSDLCNQLLSSCYGTRFSVALETTALKADGKGTKEVFDLRVIDTERGTDGSADQLSGGEKVLVSEALALAIAIYNASKSSVPMLDLFRDECAGALSHGNAIRYVEMLRRAVRLGGFHRCYYIAHQRELWDLADQRLVVADGTCTVAKPEEITVGQREQVEVAA